MRFQKNNNLIILSTMKKYFFMVMALIMALVTLTACGDDKYKDREPSGETSNSLIVGTWRATYESGDYDQVIFYSNGSGKIQEWELVNGRNVCRDEGPLSYRYDEVNERLTIAEEDGDVYEYSVLILNSTSLVIRNIEWNETRSFTIVK